MFNNEQLSTETQFRLFCILQVGSLTISHHAILTQEATPFFVYQIHNYGCLRGWNAYQQAMNTMDKNALKKLVDETFERLVAEGHMSESGKVLTEKLLTYKIKQK